MQNAIYSLALGFYKMASISLYPVSTDNVILGDGTW